jgi:asparagine synthase (glutamine-hydrolysing)
MCGILFIAGCSSLQVAADAGDRLVHRGPDASRVVLVKNHALAFNRLAIIATQGDAGMQPFYKDGVAMVCSGEIYNYRALFPSPGGGVEPRSDVDVVLTLLAAVMDDESEVVKRVVKLDGDFAFVCTDGERVVAGRDPFGVRPLFYSTDPSSGRVTAIASEAKALLLPPLSHVEVHVFPPGHVLVGGKLVRYFLPDPQPAAAGFRPLLESAVWKRVRHSERPVGVLCSGGVDSAVITSIAARMPERDALHVFTMQYRNGRSDDAFYASLMCNRLGLRHTIVEFDARDFDSVIPEVVASLETCDPNTIRAALPMYLLARHIAKHTDIKVILSGEGADELLGGYGYIRFAPSVQDAAAESDRLLGNLHMFDLLRADRCFAAFGLEVRVPFLDAELVTHGVPAEHRRPDQRGVEKMLLRDAFADFEELADCRILERPKEKFSDGTGFNYVPDLLRHLAADKNDDGTLRTRLAVEAAHYAAIFDRMYGSRNARLVVERRLPEWGEAERLKRGGDGGNAVGLH